MSPAARLVGRAKTTQMLPDQSPKPTLSDVCSLTGVHYPTLLFGQSLRRRAHYPTLSHYLTFKPLPDFIASGQGFGFSFCG